MALVYRAIWEDSRPRLLDSTVAIVSGWLTQRDIGFCVADGLPATWASTGPTGRARLSTRRLEGPTPTLRVRLVEERAKDTWTTTVTATLVPRQRTGWLWIDIDHASDDPFHRQARVAPRLVPRLVAAGLEGHGDPRVGHVRLTTDPLPLTAGELNGLVRHPERRLPLVVLGEDPDKPTLTDQVGHQLLRQLLGIAAVIVMPAGEIGRFNGLIGTDLRLDPGSARVYLPTVGEQGLRADRHRLMPRARIRGDAPAAVSALVHLLAPSAAATPPPPLLRRVDHDLVVGPTDAEDQAATLARALAELDGLRATVAELRAARLQLEEEVLDLQIEAEERTREINRQAALLTRRRASEGDGDAHGASLLPTEVSSIAEAVDLAASIPGLALAPGAARDVDLLDRSPQGHTWAASIWRALRALGEYGSRSRAEDGGFWRWCERGEAAWSWPATPKKLAMSESDAVMGNDRLRAHRRLPVDTTVDPSGRCEMQAHIKIAEGGGMLAPRIYFHDDTRGPTGLVHVGYLGPHRHMPNTRTS